MLKSFLKKMVFFDVMLTPNFVTIFYWLAISACVLTGLRTMFMGEFFGGIGYILVGLLMARVLAELILVLFEIHAFLKKISEK